MAEFNSSGENVPLLPPERKENKRGYVDITQVGQTADEYLCSEFTAAFLRPVATAATDNRNEQLRFVALQAEDGTKIRIVGMWGPDCTDSPEEAKIKVDWIEPESTTVTELIFEAVKGDNRYIHGNTFLQADPDWIDSLLIESDTPRFSKGDADKSTDEEGTKTQFAIQIDGASFTKVHHLIDVLPTCSLDLKNTRDQAQKLIDPNYSHQVDQERKGYKPGLGNSGEINRFNETLKTLIRAPINLRVNQHIN